MRFNNVIFLGIATLLFFGLGGILIIEFYSQRSFIDEVLRGWNVFLQILTGVLYGLISAAICSFIINREFFKSEKEFYRRKISQIKLNTINIIFISFCAGIGEEIFFRAALQPILGLWPTAILFVAIHGYLNPTNWKISIYGLLMVFVMAGIGYLYENIGLLSVIIAHTVIDIVLFMMLMKSENEMGYKT